MSHVTHPTVTGVVENIVEIECNGDPVFDEVYSYPETDISHFSKGSVYAIDIHDVREHQNTPEEVVALFDGCEEHNEPTAPSILADLWVDESAIPFEDALSSGSGIASGGSLGNLTSTNTGGGSSASGGSAGGSGGGSGGGGSTQEQEQDQYVVVVVDLNTDQPVVSVAPVPVPAALPMLMLGLWLMKKVFG